jgi:glycosyltransferase involved in cell wall biosynthesis
LGERLSPELTIVIPSFNEAAHISKVIDDWSGVCDRLAIDYQIVIYDAQSTDGTLAIIEEKMAHDQLRRLDLRIRPGLAHGPSVLMGYRDSTAPWVLQMDSDNAFGTSAFELLWAHREDFDILLGYRVGRQSNFARRLVTATSRLIVRRMFRSPVTDANTPYRLMRVSALGPLLVLLPDDAIAPNVIISGLTGYSRLRIFQTEVRDVGAPVGTAGLAKFKLWRAAVHSFVQVVRVRVKAGRLRAR